MSGGTTMTVDVGHPPRSAGRVEEDLQDAWDRARSSRETRVLKIVHGYGSGGAGGSTRTVVRNWTFRHRGRFRAVIEGERYSLFDEETQRMRGETGQEQDADLSAGNPGITVVWLR